MTTTREALIELAGRCERVTGPDREIDVAIAIVVRPFPDYVPPGHREVIEPGHIPGLLRCLTASGHGATCFDAERYTASIDAAMTLVPEGWSHGYRWNSIHKNARATCEFFPEPPFRPEELISVESRKCATPALALTAACLRARALAETQPTASTGGGNG